MFQVLREGAGLPLFVVRHLPLCPDSFVDRGPTQHRQLNSVSRKGLVLRPVCATHHHCLRFVELLPSTRQRSGAPLQLLWHAPLVTEQRVPP